MDRSGRDGCGIDEGDDGAEPRATGVVVRTVLRLAGMMSCRRQRSWCGGAEVPYIQAQGDVAPYWSMGVV